MFGGIDTDPKFGCASFLRTKFSADSKPLSFTPRLNWGKLISPSLLKSCMLSEKKQAKLQLSLRNAVDEAPSAASKELWAPALARCLTARHSATCKDAEMLSSIDVRHLRHFGASCCFCSREHRPGGDCTQGV